MELNKQSSDIIAVYPSVLRAFSYIIFGLILLITSISFISTNKQVIYIIIPLKALLFLNILPEIY